METVQTSFLAIVFPDCFGERSELLFYLEGTPYDTIYRDIFEYGIPVIKEDGLNGAFADFIESGSNGKTILIDNDSFSHDIHVLTDEASVLRFMFLVFDSNRQQSQRVSIKLQKLVSNTYQNLLPLLNSFSNYITEVLNKPKYEDFIVGTSSPIHLPIYRSGKIKYLLANVDRETSYFYGYLGFGDEPVVIISYDSIERSIQVITGSSYSFFNPRKAVSATIDFEITRRIIQMTNQF